MRRVSSVVSHLVGMCPIPETNKDLCARLCMSLDMVSKQQIQSQSFGADRVFVTLRDVHVCSQGRLLHLFVLGFLIILCAHGDNPENLLRTGRHV